MEPSGTWARLAEALIGTAEFTTLEVAREAGVEPAQARRLWRALGFPPVEADERLFTRSDIGDPTRGGGAERAAERGPG